MTSRPYDRDYVRKDDYAADDALVDEHLASTSNPHSVTYTQVGGASSSHLHTGVYEPASGDIQSHLIDTGNPHSTTYTQVGGASSAHVHTGVYLPIAGKAADSELLDSHDSTYFASSGHVHSIGDATTLDGHDSTYFSPATHDHSGIYEPASADIQNHLIDTSNPHSVTYSQAGAASSSHLHIGTYEPASADIQAHLIDTGNPHSVTYTQVGGASNGHLHTGIYEASNSNIQDHIESTSNPHTVTYTQVGAAASGHDHDGSYLGLNATADDSDLLEGHAASYFAISGHTHETYTSFSTGNTAPSSTPSAVGLFYIDVSNKHIYGSVGTAASSDWIQLG